jgi:hypothetical protein
MSSTTQPIGVIARLLDLSERRVQQLSREGVIPKAERGQYDLIGSVRGYVRYLRDHALKAQAGRQTMNARASSGRGRPAEMEAEESAAPVAAEQIEAAWIAVLALSNPPLALPDRLAPQVFEQSAVGTLEPDPRRHPRGARPISRPEIELEADIDLAGVSDPEADGGEGTGGSEATAGSDHQQLGGPEPPAEL